MAPYGERQKAQAKAFFLQFPEASIAEAVAELERKGIKISTRTVSQARSELAKKGLVQAGRKTHHPAPPPVVVLPSVPAAASTTDVVIDDKVMQALAAGEDVLDLDDEEIRKRLLRRIIQIAMTPTLHPDTQLSAATVWTKLKDMARTADLGPGKPLTREGALSRLVDLFKAVGPELCLEAMYVAFNIKEPSDEKAPAVEDATASGASQDSSPADDSAPQA